MLDWPRAWIGTTDDTRALETRDAALPHGDLVACSEDESTSPPPPADTFTPYQWEVSTPEEQGMDPDKLIEARREAEGKLFIHSLDQKLMDFIPEYDSPSLHPSLHDITVGELLTMRSGLGDDGSTFYNVVYTDDWIQATIEQGVTSIPGTAFAYTTSGTHLLSVILTRATGVSSMEFGRKYLFAPLGIVCESWFQDPQGYYWGGNDMRFTPRDMARFGMLFLERGTLDGEEILPNSWIRNSALVASGGDWTGGGIESMGYGYLWWVGWIGNYQAQMALGHGGQTVVIIPDLDLIVVTTAYVNPDWQEAGDQEAAITELIRDSILPAVIAP